VVEWDQLTAAEGSDSTYLFF